MLPSCGSFACVWSTAWCLSQHSPNTCLWMSKAKQRSSGQWVLRVQGVGGVRSLCRHLAARCAGSTRGGPDAPHIARRVAATRHLGSRGPPHLVGAGARLAAGGGVCLAYVSGGVREAAARAPRAARGFVWGWVGGQGGGAGSRGGIAPCRHCSTRRRCSGGSRACRVPTPPPGRPSTPCGQPCGTWDRPSQRRRLQTHAPPRSSRCASRRRRPRQRRRQGVAVPRLSLIHI